MATMINEVRLFLVSLRPKQWAKNLFVFTALVFSGHLLHFNNVLRTLAAFILFSLFSGCIYIVNDVRDIKEDRLHPVKRHRPIASGRLAPSHALQWAVGLATLVLFLSSALSSGFAGVVLSYGILMLFYSYLLKRILFVDVLVISLGFVLRIAAGAFVLGEMVTHWAMICTFFLTLFLGFSKRETDLMVQGKNDNGRWVIDGYSPDLLRMLITITASCTILAYCLFTLTSGKDINLVYTLPFVVFGILQYLHLITTPHLAALPDELFWRDPPLLINNVLWISACALILYVRRS